MLIRIVSKIGGGEVYRARDTCLNSGTSDFPGSMSNRGRSPGSINAIHAHQTK